MSAAAELQPEPGSGEMFDRIAERYDRVNRAISLGLDHFWRKRLLASVAPGEPPQRVLDLATGTADVAIAAARRWPVATLVGLDPSAKMRAIAARKLERLGLSSRVELVDGNAEALSFPDHSFDAVTIAFGIRNVPDRPRALREMQRVLRPGGRVAILELGEPKDGLIARAARLHIHGVVPLLGRLLSSAEEYRYLARSIARFPDAESFAGLLREAGFAEVKVERLVFGAVHIFSGQRLS